MIISVHVGKAFDEIQCPNMTYQKKKKQLLENWELETTFLI